MNEEYQKPKPKIFDDGYQGVNKPKRQEHRLAKSLGGMRQPLSGAIPGMKADVKLDRFLIEAKTTAAQSLSLKVAWLCKIDAEAAACSREPALAIDFQNMPDMFTREWVLIPLSVFQGLLEGEKEE